MSTRAEQKRQTRARVLRHATACFRELGYESTTISKVARRAEVSSGTVLSHFPDKASLVAAAFHAELAHAIDEGFNSLATEAAPLEQMLHVASHLYTWYAEFPGLGVALIRETLFLQGPFGDQHAQQLEGFVARLLPMLPDTLSPPARMLAAQGFFSDYFGLLVHGLRQWQTTGAFDVHQTLALLRLATEARIRGLGG